MVTNVTGITTVSASIGVLGSNAGLLVYDGCLVIRDNGDPPHYWQLRINADGSLETHDLGVST